MTLLGVLKAFLFKARHPVLPSFTPLAASQAHVGNAVTPLSGREGLSPS